MGRQPESKLVHKVRAVFEREGGRVFKIQGMDESFQEVGVPDLLICLWGLFVGVEVKMPGGKLRPLQRVVLHEIYRGGGIAAIVETVEQAESLLRSIEDRRDFEDKGVLFCRGQHHCKWSTSFR